MKLSFSLKAKPVGDAPPLKPPTKFGAFDEDENADIAVTAASSKSGDVNKRLAAMNSHVATSKATQKMIQQQMKLDQTVYQYDEVYDRMKEAEAKAKARKEDAAKERKVRLLFIIFDATETLKLCT